MPGRVFISYRREDSQDVAARIHRELSLALGAKALFMDVDNLMAGQRFDKVLEKALGECDVLLAVIGPRWLATQEERAGSAERDFVREEIAAALKREIPVIPVLVNGAQLPRAQALPEDMHELVRHQKHDVRHEHFGRDMAPLIEAIQIHRGKQARALPWRWLGAAAAVAAVLVVAAVVVPSMRNAPPPAAIGEIGAEPESHVAETAPAPEIETTPAADEPPVTNGASFSESAPITAPSMDRLPAERGLAAASPPIDGPNTVARSAGSRGWIGIKVQNLDSDSAAAVGLSETKGALVAGLVSGGPAEAAGLAVQDVITAVNGSRVSDSRDFATRISQHRPDSVVALTIWRNNAERRIEARLGSPPASQNRPSADRGAESLPLLTDEPERAPPPALPAN